MPKKNKNKQNKTGDGANLHREVCCLFEGVTDDGVLKGEFPHFPSGFRTLLAQGNLYTDTLSPPFLLHAGCPWPVLDKEHSGARYSILVRAPTRACLMLALTQACVSIQLQLVTLLRGWTSAYLRACLFAIADSRLARSSLQLV
jgi:hypothetical protein